MWNVVHCKKQELNYPYWLLNSGFKVERVEYHVYFTFLAAMAPLGGWKDSEKIEGFYFLDGRLIYHHVRVFVHAINVSNNWQIFEEYIGARNSEWEYIFPLFPFYSFKNIKKSHGGHVKSIFIFPFESIIIKSLSFKMECGNMYETICNLYKW